MNTKVMNTQVHPILTNKLHYRLFFYIQSQDNVKLVVFSIVNVIVSTEDTWYLSHCPVPFQGMLN